MNIQFHIRGINLNPSRRQRLPRALEPLNGLIPVSAAVVVVEYEREQAPAFRASSLLAVPGPDIHAEARDHTLDAAWLKVTTALRRQIEHRKSRQETRLKRNDRARARGGLRAGCMLGPCARMESVLEEWVGPIEGEFDQEEPQLRRLDTQTWELSGALPRPPRQPCADYVSRTLATAREEAVQVLVREEDGKDEVQLVQKQGPAAGPKKGAAGRKRSSTGQGAPTKGPTERPRARRTSVRRGDR